MSTDKPNTQSAVVSGAVEGDLIAGKYRVGASLATGGMGMILRGRHEVLAQDVAIKVLHAEMAHDEEIVVRFLREARVAARIDSEHVVRVFDVGTTKAGSPYMVMEYLDGVDLQALIRATGEQQVVDAADNILQALNAVTEAHAEGIVHRDLKPANLFLARRGGRAPRIKVLDFGISKMPPGGDAAPSLTSTRSMLGSPGYMSPEQIVSTRDVDERSDIWSLGVILYELLSGEQAYNGQTLGQVFAKIRETDLPAIRTLRPDVPVGLDKLLRRCLERDRNKRIPTAAAFRDALAPFASLRTRTLVMADRRSDPGELESDPFAALEGVPSTLIGADEGELSSVLDEQLPEGAISVATADALRASQRLSHQRLAHEVVVTQQSSKDSLTADSTLEGGSQQTVAGWSATAQNLSGPMSLMAAMLTLCALAAGLSWWLSEPAPGAPLGDGLSVLALKLDDNATAQVVADALRNVTAKTADGATAAASPAPSIAAPSIASPSSATSSHVGPAASATSSAKSPARRPRGVGVAASAVARPPRVHPKPNPTAAPVGSVYDDLGI